MGPAGPFSSRVSYQLSYSGQYLAAARPDKTDNNLNFPSYYFSYSGGNLAAMNCLRMDNNDTFLTRHDLHYDAANRIDTITLGYHQGKMVSNQRKYAFLYDNNGPQVMLYGEEDSGHHYTWYTGYKFYCTAANGNVSTLTRADSFIYHYATTADKNTFCGSAAIWLMCGLMTDGGMDLRYGYPIYMNANRVSSFYANMNFSTEGYIYDYTTDAQGRIIQRITTSIMYGNRDTVWYGY